MIHPTDHVSPSTDSYAQFASRHPGKVVFPSDTAYDAARAAYNTSVDQCPAVIVYAESPVDVVDALEFARQNDLPVAVQATGHGVIRKADGALLINTSRMKGIQIDPVEQTAILEAGVKWGEALVQAQAFGLAPLLGSSPDVGAIGYTLGGGMGWLTRKYGLSIDSVLSLDVVTPDAVLRHASPSENQDLFWALRGGGGGFGVVTAMKIRLHPVSWVYAGNLYYPVELAGEVFKRFDQWIGRVPDELTTSAVLLNVPPLPEFPEPLRGKSFVIVRGCYTGPMEAGIQLLSYWRDWQAPLIDEFKAMPFTQAGDISQDPIDPLPFKHTGGWLRDLSPQTAETLIRYTLPQGGPPLLAFTEVRLAGGAISKAGLAPSAYTHRDERLAWVSLAPLMAPGIEGAVDAHLEQMRSAMGASLTGKVYMNFMGGEEARQHAQEGYSPEAYQRLQEIKARYDPEYRLSYGYDLRMG